MKEFFCVWRVGLSLGREEFWKYLGLESSLSLEIDEFYL